VTGEGIVVCLRTARREDARMPRLACLSLLPAALAACNTPPRMDLRHNENLYRPTGYVAAAPADRAAFVAPVVDERTPPPDSREFPTTYLADRDWERPVPVMVHEILCDELRASGVFGEVLDAPRPDALVVKPILRAFEGGLQEQLYGRRSLTHLALHVQVLGPEVDGQRKVLFERPFVEQALSSPDFRPPSPRALLGAALHATMVKLIGAVDASNIGRSAIVTDADLRKQ